MILSSKAMVVTLNHKYLLQPTKISTTATTTMSGSLPLFRSIAGVEFVIVIIVYIILRNS
jgi:hypothetical protein